MMKKLLLFASLFFYTLIARSQSFTGTGGSIPSNGTQCFPLNVTSVGTINSTTLGLSSVCIDINHPNDDELEIWLTAPDGTEVPLTIQNGGSGNDYSNTCFSASATTYIKNGSAPFTGSFIPEGFLGAANNGQNADGVWTLCIKDKTNAGTAGMLNSWNLAFSNSPAAAAPALPACNTMMPSSVDCGNATPVCDYKGMCGQTTGNTVRTWPQLTAAATCFNFENNTFIKFIASAAIAEFAVWVPTSSLVSGDRGGIQMFAFSGTCNGAVAPYGCFQHIYPPSTPGSPLPNYIRLEGLTVGSQYYITIDGFGGATTTFTVQAISGINSLTVSPDTAVCKGFSTTLTASGGNGSYSWSPGSGLSSSSGASVTATPTTTTTYKATSTNAAGCSLQEDVVVTVNDPPIILTQPSNSPQSFCQGSPATPFVLAAAGSGIITGYQWYLTSVASNSGGLAIPGATGSTYTPLTAGTGTLYFYCVVTNSNGCSTASNITGAVTINPKPTAPIGSVTVQSSCASANGTIVITAPVGANIEYSIGSAYQASGTFNGLAAGSYTATVRNIVTGCVSSGTAFTVTSISTPPATPAGSVTVQPTCVIPTGTIVITSPLGANIEYSIGGAYQANGTFNGLTNGTTYNVLAKDIVTGCISSALPLTVNTIPGAPATPLAGVTTQPDCLTPTGTITVSAPTGSNLEYSIGGSYQPGLTFSGLSAASSFTVTVRNTLTGCVSAPVNLSTNAIAPPAAPTVTSPVTYCQNTTATALTASGSNLLWYSAATGGTGSTTAPTPLTNALGSTTYYVSQTIGTCESGRSAITVSVTNQPAAPAVTATVSYCQNATTTQLNATGSSLLWYNAASSGTGSNTAPTPSSATAGTSSYYVSQTIGTCESPRSLITVSVNATPAPPTVNSAINYCQNAPAAALTATGSNLLWYNSASGGSGSSSAPTASTAVAGNTTYYVSQTVNGCESPRASITVTIIPTPATPMVTASVAYCQNAAASLLSATGSSLLWYNAASGGAGTALTPTPLTSSAGNTFYYVSQTINGCESPRASITVTVNASPALPVTIASLNYCENAAASVLSATGTNLLWYTSASGGTGSGTAPVPSTTTAGATTYYVSQTINGCEGGRAPVTVTVNAAPVAPSVTSTINYCQNVSAATLSATGSSLLWYNLASGGSSSSSAPTPSTGVTGSAIYYVSQTISGCESPRAAITVTINPIPAAPVVTTSQTYCQGGSASILSATGSNLLWYNAASGGLGTALAPTPSTTATGNTLYYVSQTVNGCESTRSFITVTVNSNPLLPTATPSYSYCENETASILTATGTSLLWYTAISGGIGSNIAPTPPTTTAGVFNYYVSQTINGCESGRSNIEVTVNAAPATPTIADVTYCQDEIVSSTLTAVGSNLKWYSAATGGVGSSIAPTPITTVAGVTDYYVSATANGCESQRAKITVTVNPTPTVPVITNANFCRFESSVTLAATGSNLLWYTVANGGTGSPNAPTPSTSLPGIQTYYVTQTVNGCESPRASVSATVKPLPLAPIVTSPVSYCQFAAAIPLKANGSNLLWYDVASGGTGATVAPIPNTSIAGNSFYYVSQTTNGCEGPRAGITVTIFRDSTAVTNFSYSPSTVCVNATTNPGPSLPVDFTLGGKFSASPAGLSIDAATGSINLAFSQAGTYTITYTYPNGNCIKGGASSTTMQVDPAIPSYTIFSYSSPVCKNSAAVLPSTVNNFTTGGVFSSGPGLSINPATGAINVAASIAGTYQIVYRLTTVGCRAATSNTSYIIISDTSSPVTNFTYDQTTVCITSAVNPILKTANGFTTGGIFSSAPAGLNINQTNGAINIGLSTPGVYKIKYSVPQVLCRLAGEDSLLFTLNAYGSPETGFTYFSPVCKRDAVEIPTLNTDFTQGGIFSSTPGISVDPQSGVVDLSNSQPGTYNVKYDVAAEACNPAGSSNIPLTIIAQPQAPSVTGATICGPGEVILDASAAGTIKWFTEKELLNQVNVGNSYDSYVESTTNYFVTNTVGSCSSEPAPVSAVVNPLPQKPFMGSDTAICPNDKYVLNPGNYAGYLWQDGSINSTFTVNSAGTYKVVVSTNAGCKDSTALTVINLDNCDDILFPSAFTPDGNGLNDKFGPIGSWQVISNYSMRIFNRYGQVVFSSQNPAVRWDGMIKGQKADIGNYIFVASYTYKNRIARTKKGSVMIVR